MQEYFQLLNDYYDHIYVLSVRSAAIEENNLKKDLKDLPIHFSSEQIKMILHQRIGRKKNL
jgi:hypothetical protein